MSLFTITLMSVRKKSTKLTCIPIKVGGGDNSPTFFSQPKLKNHPAILKQAHGIISAYHICYTTWKNSWNEVVLLHKVMAYTN